MRAEVAPDVGLDLAAAALDPGGRELLRSNLAQLEARLETLPDKPEETPLSTLAALWRLASGEHVSAALALTQPLGPLDAQQGKALHALVAQRFSGVPLAHLTSRQHFMGVDFEIGPEALVPRRETEMLGEAALHLLGEIGAGAAPLVIDLCTGCGNLACALALRVPAMRAFASDLSPQAAALARRNAERLKLAGRIEVRQGDLLAPFESAEFLGAVDLIVCNPPYISSGRLPTMPSEIIDHEPLLAFDGGPFGLKIVQRLIQEAPRFLRPGGGLAFEVGLGQAPAVARRLTPALGYAEVRTVSDAQGAPRVIVGRRL